MQLDDHLLPGDRLLPLPDHESITPILGLIAWATALAGLLGCLHMLGRATLAPPPWLHPGLWGGWAARRGAIVSTFSLLRAAAEWTCAYLLVVTLAATTTRLAGTARAARGLDRLCVPLVARMLSAAAGASLAAALSADPLTAGAGATPAPAATSTVAALGDWSVPLMRVVAPRAPETPAARPASDTWTVAVGDCLWSIAEATLVHRGAENPTDSEVDRYWMRLISANRARLADPSAPELIFAGQVLDLPPT